MESMKITVLETYDPKFCCVCTQNGASFYLRIFENVIAYRSKFISIAQIINETLGLSVSQSNVTEILLNYHGFISDSTRFHPKAGSLRELQNQIDRFLSFQTTKRRSKNGFQRLICIWIKRRCKGNVAWCCWSDR